LNEPIDPRYSRVVGKYDKSNPDQPNFNLQRLLRLTQVALVVALILAGVAAGQISAHMSSDDVQTSRHLREASAGLCLGAGVLCIVVALALVKSPHIRKGALYILGVSALVVRPAAFKFEPTDV
jgi:peptidoglycan/LPS O-acetylase OafA/YrhL